MSDLLAARSQMAMSLAFHIIFAVASTSFVPRGTLLGLRRHGAAS